jgi:outer membrane protein assembly factor BamB
VNPASNFASANGDASHGSVVAFKIEDRNGSPALVPQWVSSDIVTPVSPVTTNGLVFVLSSGESPRLAKENGKPYSVGDREKMADHAILYVLDGATGKQLFSSGSDANTFSHASGVAIANGRVYFTTHDSTVYSYGFPALQPQLTER